MKKGSLYKRGGDDAPKDAPYILTWYDDRGKRRSKTLSSDKSACEQVQRKVTNEVMLLEEGVRDGKDLKVAEANRKLLGGHLDDFHADLLARGNTKKHADQTRTRAGRLFELAKCDRLSEIALANVRAALGQMRREGTAADTLNGYLRAVKGFSKWLRGDGRLRDDPLATMSGYNADADRRKAQFGDRSVDHALVAEFLPEPARHLVSAVVLGDFLAHDENVFVS